MSSLYIPEPGSQILEEFLLFLLGVDATWLLVFKPPVSVQSAQEGMSFVVVRGKLPRFWG